MGNKPSLDPGPLNTWAWRGDQLECVGRPGHVLVVPPADGTERWFTAPALAPLRDLPARWPYASWRLTPEGFLLNVGADALLYWYACWAYLQAVPSSSGVRFTDTCKWRLEAIGLGPGSFRIIGGGPAGREAFLAVKSRFYGGRVIAVECGGGTEPSGSKSELGESEPGESESEPGESESEPGESESEPGGSESEPGESESEPGESKPSGEGEKCSAGEAPPRRRKLS